MRSTANFSEHGAAPNAGGLRLLTGGTPVAARVGELWRLACCTAMSKLNNNLVLLICLAASSCTHGPSGRTSRAQPTDFVEIASVIAVPEELKHLDAVFFQSGLHTEIWGDRIYSVSVPLNERDRALQLLRSDVATSTYKLYRVYDPPIAK